MYIKQHGINNDFQVNVVIDILKSYLSKKRLLHVSDIKVFKKILQNLDMLMENLVKSLIFQYCIPNN